MKEITFKHCGTVFVDAKVELLHIRLPGDVANADSALYICVSKQINETSVKSSDIQSFLLALPLQG